MATNIFRKPEPVQTEGDELITPATTTPAGKREPAKEERKKLPATKWA